MYLSGAFFTFDAGSSGFVLSTTQESAKIYYLLENLNVIRS